MRSGPRTKATKNIPTRTKCVRSSITSSQAYSVLNTNSRGAEWQDINVPNWEYLGRPTDMLKRKDALHGSDDLMRKGFLAAYSQASVEEDFNLYAEWLFEARTN